MPLDLNALQSLIAVAETLSFSEAAARRNTVQSAVSAHISKLEHETGQRLFDRGRGQRARLTPQGRALVSYANRILNLADEALDHLRAHDDPRIIRLGTTVTLAQALLPQALRAFSDTYPNTEIHIICDRSVRLMDMFTEGQLEVAFMMDQGKHPGRVSVETTGLAWAQGPGFDLSSHDTIPLAFLNEGPDLRRYALDALDRCGKRGAVTHASPHPVGLRAFVEAGLALTVIPRIALKSPLSEIPAAAGLPDLHDVALSLYQTAQSNGPETEYLIQMLRREMQR